jgi:hypothetical protein
VAFFSSETDAQFLHESGQTSQHLVGIDVAGVADTTSRKMQEK